MDQSDWNCYNLFIFYWWFSIESSWKSSVGISFISIIVGETNFIWWTKSASLSSTHWHSVVLKKLGLWYQPNLAFFNYGSSSSINDYCKNVCFYVLLSNTKSACSIYSVFTTIPTWPKMNKYLWMTFVSQLTAFHQFQEFFMKWGIIGCLTIYILPVYYYYYYFIAIVQTALFCILFVSYLYVLLHTRANFVIGFWAVKFTRIKTRIELNWIIIILLLLLLLLLC
jgi:hypothetical protein